MKKIEWAPVTVEIAIRMGEVKFTNPNYETILKKVIKDLGYYSESKNIINDSRIRFSDNCGYKYGLKVFNRKDRGVYNLKKEYIGMTYEQVIMHAERLKEREQLNWKEQSDNDDDDDSDYQKIVQKAEGKNTGIISKPNVNKRPQNETTGEATKPKRDPDVAIYVKQQAQYKCDYKATHDTFPDKNGNNFVEAHHVIPMRKQGDFPEINLDQPENVVSLCPNCHRQIHNGEADSRVTVAEQLAKNKQVELKTIGIDLPIKKIVELATGVSE